MASLDSVSTRQILASGKVFQRADDASIAIRLRYVGTAASPAVVVTTASGLSLNDATASVSVPFQWGVATTMGELVDAINGRGVWEAKLLDAIRADVTLNSFKSNTTVTPGMDENGLVVWDLVHDNNIVTNGVYAATVCLSPFFNFDAPTGHRVHVRELSYYQNVNGATAASVLLYKRVNPSKISGVKNGTEVLVYSATSVDAVITAITWAGGEGTITGGENDEFIFRVQDGTSITDNAANYVRIVGELE